MCRGVCTAFTQPQLAISLAITLLAMRPALPATVVLRSKLFVPTLKEVPADAHILSHQLLLRAGFMRKSSLGIYSMLPLGLRAMNKLESTIDRFMRTIGGQKVSLPLLLTADVWRKTGRWDDAGEELFRLKDRRGAEMCLAPTHEEAITELVAESVSSYRHLPLRLYQTGKKYRDEIRPRYGLMRGREFVMKDMYTFDLTVADAMDTYHAVVKAYSQLMNHLGLDFHLAQADSGKIGGNLSHEFLVQSAVGEDKVVKCPACGDTANQEKALGRGRADWDSTRVNNGTLLSAIHPTLKGDESTQLQNTQTLRFDVDEGANKTGLLVVLRKGCEVNMLALMKLLPRAKNITPRAAPLHDGALVVVDDAVAAADAFASQSERVTVGCVRLVGDGERCHRVDCSGTLSTAAAIEVGHTFYLGTKYSKALGAKYQAKDHDIKATEMGCYGLGVSRILAVLVENRHDKFGLQLPVGIAAYTAVVVPYASSELQAAESVASRLAEFLPGDVVLDDRDERMGVRLAEANLIGYPFVLVLGKSWKANKRIEVQLRGDNTKRELELEEAVQFIRQRVPATDQC